MTTTAESLVLEPETEGETLQDGAAQQETFADFGLSESVQRALHDLGYEAPTPVQRATIRLLMGGRDVMAQAQTGTGKTAAYGIPMVERIDVRTRRVQGLVLAPTRELAIQVAEHLHQLGKERRVLVLPVYGGQPIGRQLRGLRDGTHVVVGTPGRILDHLRRGTLDLSRVELAVLDEADEMLDMGFLEDVEAILTALADARVPDAEVERDTEVAGQVTAEQDAEPSQLRAAVHETATAERAENPAGRVQMALFSATLPVTVAKLVRRFLVRPERISITPEQMTVPQIVQVAYEVAGMDKLDALARILDVETPGSAIVFCATRRTVDDVSDRLAVRGYRAAALHGDMAQGERERVLRRFRDGQIEVLVATDVAARGLDISGVTHVINFDIPWDPESYVHRIGRTGRAGRAGDAITLVTSRDYRLLRTIEQTLRQHITRKRLPTLADLATRRREATKDAVAAAIEAGELDPYVTRAGELGDRFDPVEVAAAALRLWDQARNAGVSDGVTLASALRAAAEEEQRLREESARRPAREARGLRDVREVREAREVRQSASEFDADGQLPETGMDRLLVAAGRDDGLRPQDLVGAIANEAGIPGRAIGAIDIYDRFSFVEVPQEHTRRILRSLARTTIRGRSVGVRLARPGASDGGGHGAPRSAPRGPSFRDRRDEPRFGQPRFENPRFERTSRSPAERRDGGQPDRNDGAASRPRRSLAAKTGRSVRALTSRAPRAARGERSIRPRREEVEGG